MTYKKIAESAHVSLSTVSKALSGSKEISEELSQKIIEIAIEQGYFEKKSKRKIEYAKNGAVTIAIICPEIISITYATNVTAIKNEIEARGGFSTIYTYDFDPNKLNKIIEMITVRNCADGIILFPMNDLFSKPLIPFVSMSPVLPSDKIDYNTVSCDVYAYFDDIIKYLKDLGHEKIAFVGELNTLKKLDAYQKSLEKFNIPYDKDRTYILNERFERIGFCAVEKIIHEKDMPTAIVCAYDEIALAMIHSFSLYGIEIPKQISMIGINDVPMAAYSQVPLTTVRTFQEEQGEIAINLLYDKIFGNSEAIQHIIVKHQLVERESTGISLHRET